MDIFEYAMKMELDGKNFYEEHAAKTDAEELKKILLELAGDEQKHYQLFKAMRDGLPAEYDEASKTEILNATKNVFETFKESHQDFSFPPEARDIWLKAREIEKKSEEFYRQKAEETQDEKQKHILGKIAEEEHRHWVAIENVIQFMERPRTWLEDAEWSNLEDY
jgi:rubrerythrin